MPAPSVSILIPVYNEAGCLAELHAEILRSLQTWNRSYEIIYVDDGSTDGSDSLLDSIASGSAVPTKVIHFRRNFGQTAAMSAGIDHAQGEILIPLDADRQNDPADIPALVKKLEAGGFDVVSGWRKNRHDDIRRKIPSQIANRLISLISGVRLHDYGCSLKAYRRHVIEDVRLYGEMHRFIPIYAHMQGGMVAEMEVHHRPRTTGQSKYGFGRIGKVLLDLLLVKFLLSYSVKPIYIFGGFGLGCLFTSLFPIALAIFFKLQTKVDGPANLHKDFVETPLPVMAAVLILVGFLALLQGLLAEMLMRTYFESQGKKTYLIRSAATARQETRRDGT